MLPCDASVTKLVSQPTVGAVLQITINIKVVNHSSFISRSFRRHDLVPSGYEVLNVSPQIGNWTNLYWNIGDLGSIQEAQASVYVRVKAGGSYFNTASLAPTGNYYTHLVTANIRSSVTPNVLTTADLQITKIFDNQYPQVNQLDNYTIQVKNNGPGVPAYSNVNEFLPSRLQYYSHTVSHGVISPGI
jgi:uncharacterized repeat protein (TIGR01451 family)